MSHRAWISAALLACMGSVEAQTVIHDFTGVGEICTAAQYGDSAVCETNRDFSGSVTFELLAPGPEGPDSDTDSFSYAYDEDGWVRTSFVIRWSDQAFILNPEPDMNHRFATPVTVWNNSIADLRAPWEDIIQTHAVYEGDVCDRQAGLVRRTTDTSWLDSLDFDLLAGMAPGADAINLILFRSTCDPGYYEVDGRIHLTSLTPRAAQARRVRIEVHLSGGRHANPKSHGLVAVAVFGSADFDAAQVDSQSARLGRRHAPPVGEIRIADVNRDGYPDALLRFRLNVVGIRHRQRAVILKGHTFSGESFFGVDRIGGKTRRWGSPYGMKR